MTDRLLRTVTSAAVAIVMIRLAMMAAAPLVDPDAWWHLRLGDRLWATDGRWSEVEHWSPFATEEWVPSAPLSDLAVSRIEQWFGLPAIAWLFGATLVAFVIALQAVHRRHASALPATLATVLCIVGASGSLSPRPQVISFVFLPLVLMAWLATEGDHRPRWWLIPFTWAWAMLHGYWFIGVLVGCTFVAGLVLSGKVTGRVRMKLILVPVLSLLAASLTPSGPRLMLAPFAVSERGQFVEEGRRTAFDRGQPWVVLLTIVVIVAVWLLTREGVTLSRVLLLIMAMGWLIITERTVAVAAILAAPLLASALQTLIPRTSREKPGMARVEQVSLAGIAAMSLVGLALAVPHTSERPGDVPLAFSQALDNQTPGTTVFNDYDIGGWLAWRHPELRVVIDPLADAYPVSYMADYSDALAADSGWPQFVAASRAEIAVLKEDEDLAEALMKAGWAEVATDEGYVLLEKSPTV